MNILDELRNEKLIEPPRFVVSNLCLLCYGGSTAYNCATNNSDIDLLGICLPHREYLYPQGICGFDEIPVFNDFQAHHIKYKDKEYDIKVYSLPRLFRLAMDGNPNILDFIASNESNVIFTTEAGTRIRENAHLFFSKNCISRYIGFSTAHFKSMQNRITSKKYPENRMHLYENYGYDTKDASHIIRCLMSLEELLLDRTYDPGKNGSLILDIKNGKYTYTEILDMKCMLIDSINTIETYTKLQEKPDEEKIRTLLKHCIKDMYI